MTLTEQSTRLVVEKRLEDSYALARPAAQLTLSYELRQKSRYHVTLDTGEEVGLSLPKGSVLRNGDLLEADNGLIIEVKAANEELSAAFTTNPLLLLRACYHLGHRHVPIQITESRVSYLHDDELDDMLREIGLEVVNYTGPFEPEIGTPHAHNGGTHCS
jgi:urease accessory protein